MCRPIAGARAHVPRKRPRGVRDGFLAPRFRRTSIRRPLRSELPAPRAHERPAPSAVVPSLCVEPGAVAYIGQGGGVDREGVPETDRYEPKRFFSILTDE